MVVVDVSVDVLGLRISVPTMRVNLARRIWALPTLATFIALLRVCDAFVVPGAAASLRQHQCHDGPTATTATREGSGWHSTAHSRSAPSPVHSAVSCRANVVKRSRVQMAGTKGAAAAAAAEIDEDERVKAESLKAKNDQEWQFFDTSRVNVKAGMGGNG